MTHTLHRRGDVEDLHEDFVMLIMPARGFNLQGSEEKMRQIWEVLSHYEAKLTNFGNAEVGNSHRTTMQKLKEGNHRINHAVFKDRETVKACLKELKERDFGISVVISGLYEETERICAEIGLKPHTVEHSLGIWGNPPIFRTRALLFEFLKSQGVCIIGAQHGGNYGNVIHPEHIDSDFNRCDHYISYGFTRDDLTRTYPGIEIQTKIHPLGSTVTTRKSKKKKKKIDLVFPISNNYPLLRSGGIRRYPAYALIDRQIKLLKYLDSLGNRSIYIKHFDVPIVQSYQRCAYLPLLKKLENVTLFDYLNLNLYIVDLREKQEWSLPLLLLHQ